LTGEQETRALPIILTAGMGVREARVSLEPMVETAAQVELAVRTLTERSMLVERMVSVGSVGTAPTEATEATVEAATSGLMARPLVLTEPQAETAETAA
jgi:hypothetical protein